MAWNDPTELHVGNSGQVYAAPVGTALPTATTGALNAAFTGLGYLTEDGATFSREPDFEDYMAWQTRTAVRREMTAVEASIAGELEQWNEENIKIAFGGGSITGSAPNYRYDPPPTSQALAEYSLVLDSIDGTTHFRFVVKRVTVSDSVESQFQRGALSTLAITFKALAPTDDPDSEGWYFLTDAAGFAAGS